MCALAQDTFFFKCDLTKDMIAVFDRHNSVKDTLWYRKSYVETFSENLS